ncbi:cytochrome P450 [Fomes fomentarius]|nr:cytochrome P450 [Fomes fomentarius]
MALIDELPQVALVAAVLYVSWTILRPFVVKSPLDSIPGPPASSFITGNMKEYINRDCWAFRDEIEHKYGRVVALHGALGKKFLQVYDPKAMHTMFIKEIDIFEEAVHNLRIMLGPGLLGVLGQQHKRQRKMLNPVFSTKHLREMTPIFYEVMHRLRKAIAQRFVAAGSASKEGLELDMLTWMGRATLEVLGQAGLGYSFDPLTEDHPDEFASAVKDFFPTTVRTMAVRIAFPFLLKMGSPAFRRRLVEMVPMKVVKRSVEISDIMHARSVLIYNEKKKALEKGDEALKQQISEGKDIMSILLRENMKASEEDRLPEDEIIGQISTMILAGMDTTSNSIARILQILAENPDVQERLREEIVQAVEADGTEDTIEFDKLMALPYLEAVCRETLRLSPGVPALIRDTVKDTILPLSQPIQLKDGTFVSAIPIPKGTRVMANFVSVNRDPTLWGPDAHVWRPERWLQPLPREVEEAHMPGVYANLMTFSGGSKACIGFKFAQVEIKTALCVLLQHFKFEPTGKPIHWNFAGVQYPTVGKDAPSPRCP